MKLIREKKGQNSFSITGLTLGKIMTIQHLIDIVDKQTEISPDSAVGEIRTFLQNQDLLNIDAFGNDLTKGN